jgi:hypothetical protein
MIHRRKDVRVALSGLDLGLRACSHPEATREDTTRPSTTWPWLSTCSSPSAPPGQLSCTCTTWAVRSECASRRPTPSGFGLIFQNTTISLEGWNAPILQGYERLGGRAYGRGALFRRRPLRARENADAFAEAIIETFSR